MLTDDVHAIDDGILLLSNVTGQFPLPQSDDNLFMKRDDRMPPDVFCHEQNLVIRSGNREVLLCGCAHAGIVNMVRQAKAVIGSDPTAVIGGMHLYEPTRKRYESDEYIDRVAAALANNQSAYYTCHCTGLQQYAFLKEAMGDKINYIHSGETFHI